MSDMRIIHGDSRVELRALDDCSVDAVATDPPYALVSIGKRFGADNAAPVKVKAYPGQGGNPYLRAATGFMGQKWDTGETAFDPAFWREVLRVLKPGGHAVVCGGTRTYHRMACAIEDAGFEIRDMVSWLYGSGFPKSHDVSKGIDRAAGAERIGAIVGGHIGISVSGGDADNANEHGNSVLHCVNKGAQTRGVPATDAARQWEGWGTALKPALEPIVLARKPLSESTVAANVLKWGTGALNIDGCRIEAGGADLGRNNNAREDGTSYIVQRTTQRIDNSGDKGRWPANVTHDGSDEVVAAFPDAGKSSGGGGVKTGLGVPGRKGNGHEYQGDVGFGDEGSAARFFYSAKADGLDRMGSKHPTVKPVSLMRWLVRLITPKGGTVLDCFAGTGTTGIAAIAEGLDAILIEREETYVADIRTRIDHARGEAAHTGSVKTRNKPEPKAALPLFGAA